MKPAEIENSESYPAYHPMSQVKQALGTFLGVLLFSVALWIIYREIEKMGIGQMIGDLRAMPSSSVFLAVILTPLSYAMLTGYEVLGFRYIERKLSYLKIISAAFIGYSFSNNISMTPSVAVRYRMYSTWGISKIDLSKLVVFHMLGTWLGFLMVGGIILLVEPAPIASASFLTLKSKTLLGAMMFGAVIAYFGIGSLRKGPFNFRGVELKLPSHALMGAQIILGALDWALTGVVLYTLLPHTAALSYSTFLSIFIFAQLIQIMSHVPGGLGVFESSMLFFLRPFFPASTVLSSLLVYRVIYLIGPLLIGTMGLGIFETRLRMAGRRKSHFQRPEKEAA